MARGTVTPRLTETSVLCRLYSGPKKSSVSHFLIQKSPFDKDTPLKRSVGGPRVQLYMGYAVSERSTIFNQRLGTSARAPGVSTVVNVIINIEYLWRERTTQTTEQYNIDKPF